MKQSLHFQITYQNVHVFHSINIRINPFYLVLLEEGGFSKVNYEFVSLKVFDYLN